MKKISTKDKKNLAPLPMQPHYNLFVISNGRAIPDASFTRWQIYQNWIHETLYEDDNGNIHALNSSGISYLFVPQK